MDPTVITLIEKIGAPGGLATALAIVIYILFQIYKDFKEVQAARIEDAKKFNDALIASADKNNATFTKVADAVEKAGVADDKYSEKILNELDKSKSAQDEIKQLLKELKK
jgi:hypothetical protein